MTFTTLQKNFARVIEKFETLVLESAMEHKESIADLNVGQLEQGKRVDGKNIVPKYATDAYATFKKAIGAIPPKWTPDLKVTGDFHSSIYPIIKGDAIINTTDLDYGQKLDKRYDKILGLSKQSIAELKPDLLDTLLKNTRNELYKS